MAFSRGRLVTNGPYQLIQGSDMKPRSETIAMAHSTLLGEVRRSPVINDGVGTSEAGPYAPKHGTIQALKQ